MSKLSKMVTFNDLEVYPKACKNFGNKAADCNICVKACPVHAIKLTEQLPDIQHSKCINCGACISECPVLAIDHIYKPYASTVKQLENYQDTKITCDAYEEYQMGIKVPCYYYLDLAIILLFGKGKNKVTFHTEKCEGCNKSNYFSISSHLDKLQQEINELNISLELDKSTVSLTIGHQQDQVINGLTRRELFKNLSLKRIRKLLVEEDEDISEIEAMKLSTKERMLFKRNLLNEFFPRVMFIDEQVVLSPKHFLTLSVKDGCTGCSICSQICPTDAIYWRNDRNKSDLVFSVESCIACKKCIACPEQVISTQTITYKEYLERGEIRLESFSLKKCKSCGEEFRTKGEDAQCNICGSIIEKDSSRFFA